MFVVPSKAVSKNPDFPPVLNTQPSDPAGFSEYHKVFCPSKFSAKGKVKGFIILVWTIFEACDSYTLGEENFAVIQ